MDSFENHVIQTETIELSELETEEEQKESAEEDDEFVQFIFTFENSERITINIGSNLRINYMDLLFDIAIPPPKSAKPLA